MRKLSAGMMPPHDGGPRPTAEETAALLSWLESELDRAAAESPDPGRTVPFHRLNRSEYRNAVRDLLAVDVDVAEPAARRRRELWLRQHRRRAEVVADAARALLERGRQDQPPRRRHRVAVRQLRLLPHPGRPLAGTPAAGNAVRHARRHPHRLHVPARRRVRVLGGARARLERRHAGLYRAAGARDQHRSRARRDVHARAPPPCCRRDRTRSPTTSAAA